MNSLKYFYINNKKFNYTLEFQNTQLNNYWKHNAPLIEYCETLGITIPHYCYHKNLSISGNCRMCLVELKNSPKPMVSCAMSAKSSLNNNEIFTDSPLVKKARENILEFLLLNHPLDCPICDQGGECDLQDQSLYFGTSKKRFYNFKRIVTDKNIGVIVKTVMTRCIHCTRCVRFSTEIAGTEDMGMFGRGLESEIGTYVSKSFQSELSGNVIDLCPVGALTQKPYPFLSRSWELKKSNSIDFSDGFGSNIQVYHKSNKIIKITSGFNYNENIWISDKTRFSFDGMFSPSRVLKGIINFGKNKSIKASTWKILINEIITTIYFQDHLNNHLNNSNKLTIIFNNSISLEVLNLLYILSQKYNFIELRKFEGQKIQNDLDTNLIVSSNESFKLELSKSNLCLLIGMFSRYEGINFNLNLRNRYLKGNFKVLSLGSNKNLTFPSTTIGSNTEILKDIIEGNNKICQDFISLNNPIISISSLNAKRKDFDTLFLLLEKFKTILNKYHKNWNNVNILNNSLNEVGVNYLNNFKAISEVDLKKSSGLYFVNTDLYSNNIKKLIKIKLLNYLNKSLTWPYYSITQNFDIDNNYLETLNKTYKTFNNINLPSGSFFESSGTYINTEGLIKKSTKFISTTSQTKEDWQIIRKLIANLSKLNFLNKRSTSTLITNLNNFNKFKTFINYIYYSNIDLTTNSYINSANSIKKSTNKVFIHYKSPKKKIFSTKFIIWLTDFYIGNNDSYSKKSITMINCSKNLRLEKNNFSHLI